MEYWLRKNYFFGNSRAGDFLANRSVSDGEEFNDNFDYGGTRDF